MSPGKGTFLTGNEPIQYFLEFSYLKWQVIKCGSRKPLIVLCRSFSYFKTLKAMLSQDVPIFSIWEEFKNKLNMSRIALNLGKVSLPDTHR